MALPAIAVGPRVAGLLAAGALALLPLTAQACARDGVPSASLDGRLAVLNRATTHLSIATYAPFVFARSVGRSAALTLAEDNGEIARAHALPADVFKRPWCWGFGDGTPSVYGTRVRHTYRKSGTYRIRVQAYYAVYGAWQDFDYVTIHVR